MENKMNKLFHTDNGIMSLSPLEIEQGLADDFIELTPEESEAFWNPPSPLDDPIQVKIQEAYHYLNETDYIVTKIAEAQALGIDIEPDLIKYEQELSKREEARILIREFRNT